MLCYTRNQRFHLFLTKGGQSKCLQERAFSTPPDANGIDFDSLYDELSHRASLFNKNNPDPDSDSDTMPYNA